MIYRKKKGEKHLLYRQEADLKVKNQEKEMNKRLGGSSEKSQKETATAFTSWAYALKSAVSMPLLPYQNRVAFNDSLSPNYNSP